MLQMFRRDFDSRVWAKAGETGMSDIHRVPRTPCARDIEPIRWDANSHIFVDERVENAMRDPLFEERDRDLIRILCMHRGAANAIGAKSVLDQLHIHWDENARRWLKGAVSDLVTRCGVPIGGSRFAPRGYFLIASAADMDVATNALISEWFAILRRIRALTGKQRVARLHGQMMLRLDLFADTFKEAPDEEAAGERGAA
jgi:hypothetical protein